MVLIHFDNLFTEIWVNSILTSCLVFQVTTFQSAPHPCFSILATCYAYHNLPNFTILSVMKQIILLPKSICPHPVATVLLMSKVSLV